MKEKEQKYLDKLKKIEDLVDMIHGDIGRICVADSLTEYENMCAVAKRHLDRLMDMVYEALMVKLAEKEKVRNRHDKRKK